MLFALCTKLVKVDQVGRAGNFLIAIMPPMFIPSAVGLVTVWSELRPQLFPVVVITFVTTVLVMVVTGWVAQLVIRKKKGGEGHDRNTQ
jgi:holin-like protein